MKNRSLSAVSRLIMVLFLTAFLSACKPPQYPVTTNTDLHLCIGDPDFTETLTVAHRGTGSLSYYAPENTLAAYDIAWKMGADSVEMDVRSTKDKELVLMHDENVIRTTVGCGNVSDKTLAEMKKLKVRPTNVNVAPQQVPTFKEALGQMKGKTMVYVDVKTDDIGKVVKEIEETGMINSAYLYVTSPAEGFAARSIDSDVALLPTAETIENAKYYIDNLSPVYMFELTFDNASKELVDFIHSQGIKIHMDAILKFDVFGKAGFDALIDNGVDSIQTDRIDLLVPYIKGY